MRKRYQKGSLRKVDGFWIAQWWEQGHRRKRWLGRVSELTKTQAQTQLAEILSPINNASAEASAECEFGDFVNNVFFPFYERKWKRSTAMTNKDRIRFHVCSEFAPIPVGRFTRDQLQRFLDAKANAGLSFSTVDHLRWDLSQIFKMAVAETFISKNPARLLFTPREARRFEKRIMNLEEVRTCFSVLELRERLIAKLAILAGMRPGEIFAMKWSRLKPGQAEIKQRLYRGDIDSPKTVHSVRTVALSRGTAAEIEAWNVSRPDTNPDAWVFPSEKMTTPLTKYNVWRRHIAPRLKAAGLEWVNFQVMRRTHSSLMNELKVDPKTVADQLGHTVDVNQNVYTLATLDRRLEAVNVLESVLEAAPARLNGAVLEPVIQAHL